MEEKLNELGGLDGKKSAKVALKTQDGGEFWVKEMSGREWLSTIGELGESVWENAALPENYWNKDQNYNQSNIHVPPLFAGVSDGVVEEVSDYPQLVKLAYDVASKKEIREELWNSVKNIDADKVINFAKDEIKNKWESYNFTNKPYLGKHELGKDGVAIVKFATGAGALVKGIKETGEKFAKKITFKSLSNTGFVNPMLIRFSQNSISSVFKDGTTIYDLIKKLKNKTIDPKLIPPIRIVEKDGLIYTLDNRRLKVFQEAGIDVPYEKLNDIPQTEIFKFTTKNEGITIEIRSTNGK